MIIVLLGVALFFLGMVFVLFNVRPGRGRPAARPMHPQGEPYVRQREEGSADHKRELDALGREYQDLKERIEKTASLKKDMEETKAALALVQRSIKESEGSLKRALSLDVKGDPAVPDLKAQLGAVQKELEGMRIDMTSRKEELAKALSGMESMKSGFEASGKELGQALKKEIVQASQENVVLRSLNSQVESLKKVIEAVSAAMQDYRGGQAMMEEALRREISEIKSSADQEDLIAKTVTAVKADIDRLAEDARLFEKEIREELSALGKEAGRLRNVFARFDALKGELIDARASIALLSKESAESRGTREDNGLMGAVESLRSDLERLSGGTEGLREELRKTASGLIGEIDTLRMRQEEVSRIKEDMVDVKANMSYLADGLKKAQKAGEDRPSDSFQAAEPLKAMGSDLDALKKGLDGLRDALERVKETDVAAHDTLRKEFESREEEKKEYKDDNGALESLRSGMELLARRIDGGSEVYKALIHEIGQELAGLKSDVIDYDKAADSLRRELEGQIKE